jgi:hypothetical protein
MEDNTMKKSIFRWVGWAAMVLLFSYCAQPGTPTGGPQDKEGPVVQDTFPLARTLNFQGDEVVLKFNEYIKLPTYGTEIFISPFMAEKPQVKMSGKKLKIQFKEALKPSTTYVLSFIDIKDFNANNKMEPPFTLAFSTGAVIDSMGISGQVLSRENKGVEDYTIMLFEADSVQENDFLGKRPAYLTKTDKSGNFTLAYLRNIPYKIYGISDIDRSNTYSLTTEPLALASMSLITFSDSIDLTKLEMKAFLPDEKAPALRSYQWLSDSVMLCEFTRGLRADSLRMHLTDTLGQDSLPISNFTDLDQKILLELPVKREEEAVLHFRQMVDSLGHRADSSLRWIPRKPEQPDFYPLFTPVEIDPDEQAYVFHLPKIVQEEELELISLRDTGDHAIPVSYKQDQFKLWVKPDTEMVATLFYYLCLDGSLMREADTVFRYKVSPWEPETYGSLSGTISIENYDGPFVAFFTGPRNLSITDSVFSFSYLPAGDYKVSVLLDEDGSQSWTTGSLAPYKLPERILQLNTPITIRANWTIEDQLLEFQAIESVPDSVGN